MVLAHRGDHTRARENTAASFEAARSAGADGIELDVRRSADGVLIVHHDSSADGIGVLVHAAFEAIRSTLPWVPTLDEALDACVGLSLVNIEIKNIPTEPGFRPHRACHRRRGRPPVPAPNVRRSRRRSRRRDLVVQRSDS
ncbi:MAG: glycerophosphodiester phosphodiesterase [Acidimicrobiia bacterium]|nr:glycerophosphodiester phosphodiesterase [Acidimicrobiia bacterium]